MARTLFSHEENRLNYGKLLMPDSGYDVEFAVGFTYSLDMEALLSVPIWLGLLDDIDSGLADDPFLLLEAIRRSSDKISIFCNAGSISMPRKIREVFALLEDSVFTINLKGMNSFHPKLWFIKYTDDAGASKFKLIVLTRNLTFDQSFDYAVEMTANKRKTKLKINQPLADMLIYAAGAGKVTGRKRKMIEKLANEILYAGRFELNDRFAEYEFIPIGFTPGKIDPADVFSSYRDLLVVSPFLQSGFLEKITSDLEGGKTLFTRKSSLTKDIIALFDEVYITKDIIVDIEETAEKEKVYGGCDIHAKIYFTEGKTGNFLYIGSANATGKAYNGNVEFLLKLKFAPRIASYRRMREEFLPEKECPFEKIKDIDEAGKNGDNIRRDLAFREALRAISSGEVVKAGERYSIALRVGNANKAKGVQIAPAYLNEKMAWLRDGMVFKDMQLSKISEFFIIKIGDDEILAKIRLKNIPRERDQAIYRNIIKDKNGFFSYVSLMLSESYASWHFDGERSMKQHMGGSEQTTHTVPAALYERMLDCTVNNPRRLLGIDSLLNKLDDDLKKEKDTEKFIGMYLSFREIARKMAK